MSWDCTPWHEAIRSNASLWEMETTPAWTQVDFQVVTYGHCKVCCSTIGRVLDREPLVTQ